MQRRKEGRGRSETRGLNGGEGEPNQRGTLRFPAHNPPLRTVPIAVLASDGASAKAKFV